MSEIQENEEVEITVCDLCGITKHEPMKDKKYCENCLENLHQAYQWMQSPMLSTAEIKKLNEKIMALTDVDSIVFED